MTTLLVLSIGFFALVIWSKYGTSLPLRYRLRGCEGRGWRREFPNATKREIREFLLLFTSAFAFKDSEKLKFSPHDRISRIYRELYPSRWMPDSLEVETLDKDLCNKHGIELSLIWSEELTLGELFAHINRHAV